MKNKYIVAGKRFPTLEAACAHAAGIYLRTGVFVAVEGIETVAERRYQALQSNQIA